MKQDTPSTPGRRRRVASLFIFLVGSFLAMAEGATSEERLNVLLIVADDLSYDSLGYAGGVAPDVTPRIDALREQSVSFEQAFATVSVCQPSRQSMMTGLMPHNYGSVGFFPIKDKVATLSSVLGDAGYVTAVIHKVDHMLPHELFKWDFTNESLGLLQGEGYVGRDPQNFVKGITKVISAADAEEAPFFVVANSADPHRPFHGDPLPKNGVFWGDEAIPLPDPSRVYSPDEVNVPADLVDLPGVRQDLSRYASSVRRLDDMVGACLDTLEKSGKTDSTIVIFVSDNGMPLPFGKFETYFSSNRTPFIMHLPGAFGTSKVDDSHLVSLLDIFPTVLDYVGVAAPDKLDGKSLKPFIEDRAAEWRDEIVMLRYEDIFFRDGVAALLRSDPDGISKLKKNGWVPRPDHTHEGTYSRNKQQRCYFDGRFAYIYNDWYDPKGLEINPLGVGVPYGDKSLRSMKKAVDTNPDAAARVEQYLLRFQEELYDWTKDPASRVNLVDNPEYASELKAFRGKLQKWMKANNDALVRNYEKTIGDGSE